MKRTPLRKQRRKKSLRKVLWPEFSKLIRARDGKCLFAGYFGRACGGVLQCCHILPKGTYPLLELFPLNVVAGCYTCHHFGWHKSPVDAGRWMADRPEGWMARLFEERDRSLTRKNMTEIEIRNEWIEFGLIVAPARCGWNRVDLDG